MLLYISLGNWKVQVPVPYLHSPLYILICIFYWSLKALKKQWWKQSSNKHVHRIITGTHEIKVQTRVVLMILPFTQTFKHACGTNWQLMVGSGHSWRPVKMFYSSSQTMQKQVEKT